MAGFIEGVKYFRGLVLVFAHGARCVRVHAFPVGGETAGAGRARPGHCPAAHSKVTGLRSPRARWCDAARERPVADQWHVAGHTTRGTV